MAHIHDTNLPDMQQIRNQAISYITSNPGRDSLANNISAHRQIRKCVDTLDSMTPEMFTAVQIILQYQITQIELAETWLRHFQIPAPRPQHFDHDKWFNDHKDLHDRAGQIGRMIGEADLFPESKTKGAGMPWSKPRQYMSAALAETGLELTVIKEMITLWLH